MVEEWVEIRVKKLGEGWEFEFKGTIPPFDSEAVQELNEAIGDIGGVKIDGGFVVGKVVGSMDQILGRLDRLKDKLIKEVRGKLIKAVEEGLPTVEIGPPSVSMVKSPVPTLKERAKAIKPYPRLGTAWIQGGYKALDLLKKKYAVICSVRFGACGYQDADYGLTIELKSEDGWHSKWSFFSMEDIYELMDRTKASSLKALVRKPMFVYVCGFNSVAGVDVNDALIL